MNEDVKVDESTEFAKTESNANKPSEYEIKLRKENEQLRKKLEAKLEEERKAKELALAEQGKYKELYETIAPQFEQAVKDLQAAKEEKEKLEALQRDEILESFDDVKREIVKDLPLEKLRELAKLEKMKPIDNGKAKGKPAIKETGFKSVNEWLDNYNKQK